MSIHISKVTSALSQYNLLQIQYFLNIHPIKLESIFWINLNSQASLRFLYWQDKTANGNNKYCFMIPIINYVDHL